MLLKQTADVVVAVAAAVVATNNAFLAYAPSSVEALKSATLLKGLRLNALISGESGTGKKSLARYIFPQAPLVSADNFFALLEAVKESKEVIITHFEKISNADQLKETIEGSGCRIVATTSVDLPTSLTEKFFSITIDIPPLEARPEDIRPLCQKFLEEFSDIVGIQESGFCDKISLDISQNAHSLKRSIMTQALFQSISEQELMQLFESFLREHMPSENAYRESLHLFDLPIIKVGLEKYKSQLKLSEVLGINRNTLRKKITQYSKEYKYE